MRITKRQLKKLIREYHQGYDAHEDESLGMRRGPARDHSQSEKDRRDDSYGKWGSRGDKSHHHDDQGYDDREDERLGMEHGAEDEHEQSDHDRRDDARGKWGSRAARHEAKVRRIVKETIKKVIKRR